MIGREEFVLTAEIKQAVQRAELLREIMPRHLCELYIGGREAVLMLRTRFDDLVRKGEFKDGPYKETFGDGLDEPYNPNRQAFGTLKDSRVVFCELDSGKNVSVRNYLEGLI